MMLSIMGDLPQEELEKVELEPKKKKIIGQDLGVIAMAKLISHFSRNINVFAWKVEDMPGINPKVEFKNLI